MVIKIWRMIRALASLLRVRSWGPFVETAERTHFDHAFSVSWSQGGEDLALEHVLSGTARGRYLDIGAHDPSRFSITRKLYTAGWSGVNVDANRLLIARFDSARPRDVNVVAAVGDMPEFEFAVFAEPAISTVSRDWESRFLAEGQEIIRRERVAGVSLRQLLDENFPGRGPELLSIDIEGADEIALRSGKFESMDLTRWPEWLLLETTPPVSNALSTGSVKYALDLGYIPTLVLTMSTLLRRPGSWTGQTLVSN